MDLYILNEKDERKLDIYKIGFIMAAAGAVMIITALFLPASSFTETSLSKTDGSASEYVRRISFFSGSFLSVILIIAAVAGMIICAVGSAKGYVISVIITAILGVLVIIMNIMYLSVAAGSIFELSEYTVTRSGAGISVGMVVLIIGLILNIISGFLIKIGNDDRARIKSIRRRARQLKAEREKRKAELDEIYNNEKAD